jgi:hypothetical protein
MQATMGQMGSMSGADQEALRRAMNGVQFGGAGGTPGGAVQRPMASSGHEAAIKQLQGVGAVVTQPAPTWGKRGTLSGSEGLAPGTLSHERCHHGECR